MMSLLLYTLLVNGLKVSGCLFPMISICLRFVLILYTHITYEHTHTAKAKSLAAT